MVVKSYIYICGHKELYKTKEEKNLCMKHAGGRHRTGLTDCKQEKVNWRRALLRSVMSGSAWNPLKKLINKELEKHN